MLAKEELPQHFSNRSFEHCVWQAAPTPPTNFSRRPGNHLIGDPQDCGVKRKCFGTHVNPV